MSRYSAISANVAQVSPLAAQSLAQHLVLFLTPLLRTLDQHLDVRLVRTCFATIVAIIQWRNRPPGGPPICVPGLHWLGLLVLGQRGAPVVAARQWWTSRGPRASDKRTQVRQLLSGSVQAWGRQVRHSFARDCASGPWLTGLLAAQLGFVLRWKKGQKLLDG